MLSLLAGCVTLLVAVPLPEEIGSTATRHPVPLGQTAIRARLERIAAGHPANANPLQEKVCEAVKVLLANDTRLQHQFPAPVLGNQQQENAFKQELIGFQMQTGLIVFKLDTMLEELDSLQDQRGRQTKAWQANYDYVRARLAVQIALVYEYNSQLGQMRKEFPPIDLGKHRGWQLVSREGISDRDALKYLKRAGDCFAQLSKDQRDTPWEKIAEEEPLAVKGLKWEPLPR
jgi:hypothetical protein